MQNVGFLMTRLKSFDLSFSGLYVDFVQWHMCYVGNCFDVTSKVGDHVKFDEASPFFLVNLCQHQNKKNVMSTIMKTMIISSFLCIFAKY